MMVLFLLFSNGAWAQALDAHDAGEYVLLNQNQVPTNSQMRFYQRDGQWMMDAKRGNENWQAVCRGTGQCQLQIAPAQKVREWQMLLPRALQTMPMACINNVAFAFCRVSQPTS